MQRGIDIFYRLLEGLLVALLFSMVVMVFGNVVLRYGFNSGILISEELARFFFVWLTFLGAVVTFHEHGHLGIETLVQRFSRRGRLICMGLSNAIIILCAVVFFWGALMQFDINATMFAPVSGLSLAWVYGIGLFTGAGVFIIALTRLIKVLLGQATEEDIARFVGEHPNAPEAI